jgi:hypothetical protein
MAVLALACGAGFALELRQAFHFGAGGTAAAMLLLLAPTAVLGWLWFLLWDLSELPGAARRVFAGLRDVAASEPPAPPAAGMSNVFRMGGSLREAAGLAVDAGGLAGAIAGVMLLANPIFLLAIAASLASVFVLGLLALAGGLLLL